MTAFFENGFTPLHAMILASALFAVVMVELGYMVFSSGEASKKRINRRMDAERDKGKVSQKHILTQLRKERGLNEDGSFIMPMKRLNRLITRSGLTLGLKKLGFFYLLYLIGINGAVLVYWQSIQASLIFFPLLSFGLPIMWLKRRAAKKTALFASQLPEAIDLITRSLKAGHPTAVAVTMVAREMPDPIGTEFGIVSDEVTYGSDLITALKNMHERVDLPDLSLLISSVSIQSTTGGNLREILEGLSSVIRDRAKMKLKIKAISAEGRMSALFLSAMPVMLFGALNFLLPHYYGEIWGESLLWKYMAILGTWLGMGNLIIMKMVSFKF
ncbi:MAG: type II secretion system F family protein [Rhizobiaceae bacterium]|nr:type II secretion system F family protein [Rhizobiaceae bacterium]